MSLKIIKFLDKYMGKLIYSLLFSKHNEIDMKNSSKILIIQLWGIGETILTLPAVSSIRERFPDSEITVLCTERNKEVFHSSGLEIKTITLKLNPLSILGFLISKYKNYNIAVDMEEYLNVSAIISFFTGKQRIGYSSRKRLYTKSIEYNGEKHTKDVFMDLAKLLDAEEKQLSKLKYHDSDNVNRLLSRLEGKIIGIVPGAAESGKSRMWPKERFISLSNKLTKYYSLIFIGSNNEKILCKTIIDDIHEKKNVINTAGLFSLNELFCLIDKIDLLITNDTGPLHIASAQKTKTIGLFGPNLPKRFGPLTKGSATIYKPNCEFSPCINVHKGEVPDCLPNMISKGLYQNCMNSITVDDVYNTVKKIID